MAYLHNCPRVFLSHSKADIDFIQRVCDDLRHCQIDPWLDEIDIRHGEPWLDAIFESGIPTCDCILVYLTESSIESTMVKKEIDASIMQKLKDSQVAFLPYVRQEALRGNLRSDLQALQAPEWNDDNYHDMFPRVVAEIWHSYMDRSISAATNSEKVKRLEAEAALKEQQAKTEATIFSGAEEKDFSFIRESLNIEQSAKFSIVRSLVKGDEVVKQASYSVNILGLLLGILQVGDRSIKDSIIGWWLSETLKYQVDGLKELPEGYSVQATSVRGLIDSLRIFGLVQESQFMDSVRYGVGRNKGYRQVTKYRTEFTDKMHRFRYWLVSNDLASIELSLKLDAPFELPLS